MEYAASRVAVPVAAPVVHAKASSGFEYLFPILAVMAIVILAIVGGSIGSSSPTVNANAHGNAPQPEKPIGIPTPRNANRLLSLDNVADVRSLQSRLSELGYYTLPVDGTFSPNTRVALIKFQLANNISGNGTFDMVTQNALFAPVKPKPEPRPIPSAPSPSINPSTNKQMYAFDNYDIVGDDISSSKVGSREQCESMCQANSFCNAYSYDKWSKFCFLKNSSNSIAQLEPNSITGLVGKPYISKSQAPITTDRYKGKDIIGSFTALPSTNWSDCNLACSLRSTCVAFTFYKADSTCRLFTSADDTRKSDLADSGVRRQK